MSKRILLALAAVLLMMTTIQAQSLPTHSRELFHDDLQSAGVKSFGEVTNYNGSFVAGQGWQAYRSNSQLRIDLKDYLPFEGTLEVKIVGLMPDVNDDWMPISIWNRTPFVVPRTEPTFHSFAYFKTDHYQITGSTGHFTFGSKVGVYKERQKVQSSDRTWNQGTTYTFRLIWKSGYIWASIGDGSSTEVLGAVSFENQVESFRYIVLGYIEDSETGYKSFPVTYKDLILKVPQPQSGIIFSNVAQSTKTMMDSLYGGQSASWSDVDGDGLQDMYVSYSNSPKSNLFYRQLGDGTFAEQGGAWGIAGGIPSMTGVFADFNKDGNPDLFQGNYNVPNKLYINNGATALQDRSSEWGVSTQNRTTASVVALDIDNDGDMDLYSANIGDTAPHELYVNQGNNTFQRTELSATSSPRGSGIRAAAGDVDGDGWTDIFYTRKNAACVLLINKRNGTFEDQAVGKGVAYSGNTNSPALVDYDNDGDLDLFITQAGTSTVPNPPVLLYENVGGTFSNKVSNISINSVGIIPGDFNNDGYIDLYFIRTNEYVPDVSSRIYRNNGDKTFTEIGGTGAEVNYADGRGGAVADYNADGRLDIYAVAKGGMVNSMSFGRNYLLKNETPHNNNYLPIAIIDEHDQVNGIGAKVRVYQAGHLGDNNYLLGYRDISSVQGYQSQPSLVQHFGLGARATVDIQVVMPGGKTVTRSNVTAIQPGQPYQRYDIKPSAANPQSLELVKGAAQMSGTAGSPLADSIIVRVRDVENKPVSGYAVSFQITVGGGKLNGGTTNPLSINTDQYGQARVAWTLGTVAGKNNNSLTVTAKKTDGSDLTGSPINLTASANPGNPAKLAYVSGSGQTGVVLQDLNNPLIVRVTDQYDNVIKTGHPVSFDVTVGGGTLAGGATGHADATTDTSGLAQTTWHLGSLVGTQKVNASSSYNGLPLANSPREFTATANQPQLKLVRVSPRLNTGVVGQILNPALEVRIEDLLGAPQSDKTVKFIVVSGGGKLSGQDTLVTTTGTDGKASATATLGTAAGDSNNVFHAKTDGAQGSPVDFKATALAGPAFKLQEISGNNKSGIVNRLLAEPFVVRVLDAYNNAIGNYSSVGYQVTRGGGTINGAINASITTDANGYASPTLRLGSQVDTNKVVASATSLQGSPITFKAMAQASVPAKLNEVSGNPQSGNAGQTLPRPFVVSVTDSFANPISSHNVHFEVTEGGGNIGGSQYADVPTSPSGEALVTLTLGPTAYRNRVTVTSLYNGNALENSPIVFEATTGPGDPDSLVYDSGDHQIGRISSPLPQPFQVKVTDANGIPIANHDVTFIAFTPGCSFSGLTQRTVQTNSSGIASITATIGSNYGLDNNEFQALAKFNDVHLNGSPFTFKASGRKSTARKMVYVSGNGISGTVGQSFPDTLQVRMLDANNQPVASHEVKFERVSGSSLFDNGNTSKSVSSNANGIAKVGVKLATSPGVTKFKASTDDGFEQTFQGSPIEFDVTAVIGPPDSSVSTIAATPDSLVVEADAKIAVTLKDAHGNAISGKTVALAMEGLPAATLTQPLPTGVNGRTEGSVTSKTSGKMRVWAMVDDRMIPDQKVEIEFYAGKVAITETIGDLIMGVINQPLSEPVGVILWDKNRNFAINRDVYFSVRPGDGSIAEPQPVKSDSFGQARVHWTLGPTAKVYQHLYVNIPEAAKTDTILAYADNPPIGSMEQASGDSLIGIVHQRLGPFKVRVKDANGQPLQGVQVQFNVSPQDGYVESPNPVATDVNGIASAYYMAGGIEMAYQIQASADSKPSVIFNFYIDDQRTLTLDPSQDTTSTRPGDTDGIKLSVKAKDYYGRKVVGEKIKFEVTQVDGENDGIILETQPRTTDASGEATATWILGWPELLQSVKVTAPDAPGTDTTTFNATLDNKAPIVKAPTDTSIAVGQELKFRVLATDLDGDQVVSYGARNLPPGAQFDSLDTREFSWTPALGQEDTYQVTFIAIDQYEAVGTAHLIIHVGNINHEPNIRSFFPEETYFKVKYDSLYIFFVEEVIDQDGDSLSFRWYVGGAYAGSDLWLKVSFPPTTPSGNVVVEVIVSDGKADATVTWNLQVSVTLSSFEASPRKNAIELVWRTAAESNNLGFNVLRSMNKSGPFRQINQLLIQPTSTASYSFVDKDVQAGMTYYYKLQDVERNGAISEHGPVSAQVALPTELALAQNYPNPFNPATTISFELPAPQNVRLVVYNIAGQEVRTLVNGAIAAGVHDILWDARNDAGQAMPTGVYFYRLYTAKEVLTKKLLLAK